MMIRFRQLRLWFLASVLAASSLRCGGDGGVGPTTAKAIDAVTGDGQTGRAGQELINPLVVAVTDASGNPVPGIEVHWAAQGGGSVSGETTKTGSDGHASVKRVLGPDIGRQTTTASVSGL